MRIIQQLLFCLCIQSIMSFRSLSRSSMKALRLPTRMMSDQPELRTYASFSVYKGKCAMQVKPIAPTFKATEKSLTVSREGALFLEFAPTTGAATREYDWSRKTSFSLTPLECAEIIRLGDNGSAEFVHDPNQNNPESGKIVKKFKLFPTPDGRGIFASLNVADRINPNGSASYTIVLSWAEMELFKNLMQYSIPRLLGFDKVF